MSNIHPLKYPILTVQNSYALTSEHGYQSAKFAESAVHYQVAHVTARERGLDEQFDGIASKHLAHELIDAGELVHLKWGEPMKLAVMEDVVRRKFIANPDLLDLLLATGDQILVDGNDWGDRFWGVNPIGSDNGQNNLGIILMHVRAKLARQAAA